MKFQINDKQMYLTQSLKDRERQVKFSVILKIFTKYQYYEINFTFY